MTGRSTASTWATCCSCCSSSRGALIGVGVFKFPLFSLVIAGLGWYFVTDLISSGGNWSAWVTLLAGFFLFVLGLGNDGGDTRPYGFWVHVVAGLTIGGALLYWWHSSDFQWALIIVVGLMFMAIGAALRRSSYGVIGTVGLVLATSHYVGGGTFGITSGSPSATKWQGPVGFLCLGLRGARRHRFSGAATAPRRPSRSAYLESNA